MDSETTASHQITGPEIYTDGSKIEGKTGAALTWWENGKEVHHSTLSLGPFCTVFQAELYALHKAVEQVRTSSKQTVNILSDSRSSLELLKNAKDVHPLSKAIKENVEAIRMEGRKIRLFWLRAHVGTLGNERADELAKQAALTPTAALDYEKVPLSYAKKTIREESVRKWQDRYETSSTGAVTKRFLPDVCQSYRLVRATKLTPIQVQALTGHGGISEYLHRFKLKSSPACECDDNIIESVWHIIIDCPRFLKERTDLETRLNITLTENVVSELLLGEAKIRNAFLAYIENIFKIATARNSTLNQSSTTDQTIPSGTTKPGPTRVLHTTSIQNIMENGEIGSPGLRTRSVVLFMNTNYERLGIGFCCSAGTKRVSISPGVALLLKGSTTKTSMKRKRYDALSELEVAGLKARLARHNNKSVLLLDRTVDRTQFTQACTLLQEIANYSENTPATPRIISVDAMTVEFDKGTTSDLIGCIKASQFHEVVVYENRNQKLDFLRPLRPPTPSSSPLQISQGLSTPPKSGSEQLQQLQAEERMAHKNTPTKRSKISSLLKTISTATLWVPQTIGRKLHNRATQSYPTTPKRTLPTFSTPPPTCSFCSPSKATRPAARIPKTAAKPKPREKPEAPPSQTSPSPPERPPNYVAPFICHQCTHEGATPESKSFWRKQKEAEYAEKNKERDEKRKKEKEEKRRKKELADLTNRQSLPSTSSASSPSKARLWVQSLLNHSKNEAVAANHHAAAKERSQQELIRRRAETERQSQVNTIAKARQAKDTERQAAAVEEFFRPKPSKHTIRDTTKRTRADMGLVQAPKLKKAENIKDHMANALEEFVAINRATKDTKIAQCKKIMHAFEHQNEGLLKVRLEEADATIYNNETTQVLKGSPMTRHMAAYNATAGIVLLDRGETRRTGKIIYQTPQTDPIVVTTQGTEIWLEDKIIDRAHSLSSSDPQENWVVPKITWVNGVPGCGKTTWIIQNFKSTSDIVATTTSEAKRDLREKVSRRAGVDAANRIRTMASILANGVQEKVRDECNRLIIDEALMNHFGSIAMVSRILRVKELLLIGDINQVPYIDRDNLFKLTYLRPNLLATISQELLCTHRCPMDVAYALQPVYSGIYSSSRVVKSLQLSTFRGSIIPKEQPNTLYLTFTQAEKETLIQQGYGKGMKSKVLTIHEAQGLYTTSVIIIRSTTRRQQVQSSVSHAVVAISRHTNTCTYYTVDSDDAIGKFIKKANSSTEKDVIDYNLRMAIQSRDDKVMEQLTQKQQTN